MEIDISV